MASKGTHTGSGSQQKYVMENRKHLTPVSSPSRPRRKIVIAVCVVVVIVVVAVLLGTLVPKYMANSSEKARSKEKLQEKVKESIRHPDGSHKSVIEMKTSPNMAKTSHLDKTSSPTKVLSTSMGTSTRTEASTSVFLRSSSSLSAQQPTTNYKSNPTSSTFLTSSVTTVKGDFSSVAPGLVSSSGSVSEIKSLPEPVSTTSKIMTSSPFKVLSANNKASSSSSVSLPSTPPVLEQSVTSQSDSNSHSIVPTRSTAGPSLSHITSLVPNIEAKWSRWTPWNDCTKTCGRGTRFRTRNCVAQNQQAVFAPISCAGRSQQNKTCAEWSCPDCNRTCTTGALNDACDACICAHHVLTGRVLTESGVPLSDANISLAETPYNVLARTNVSGYFTVQGVCTDQQELLVTRAGFVPLQKLAKTPLTAKLENAVPPSVTVHPLSKMRLPGQNVTFCCDGEGKPPPAIEWFKDGNIIDQELYGYNRTIDISDVSGLGGSYRCRAVNDFGSEFSDPADLVVLDPSQASCNTTPISRNITLPPGCVLQGTNNSFVDVGDCAPSRCLQNDSAIFNTCRDQIFCCGVKETADMKVDCGGFATFNISKVTSCGCGHCSEPTTVISGVVVGGTKEQPIRLGSIKVDGKEIAVTDLQGSFSFTISEGKKRIAVTFTDSWFGNFEDVIRVFRVQNGQNVFSKIVMKEKQAPRLFNSSKPLQVPLGDIPGQSAFADLEIPESALLKEDGTMHESDANLRLSVMDSRNDSDIVSAPGDFSAVDEDGEEQILQTYGMLKLSFEDSSGKLLAMSKPIKVYLDPDKLNITTDSNGNTTAKLWWLDEKTGRWMQAGDIWMEEKRSNRSRREDQRKFLVTEITPAIQRGWLNFDAPSNRTCVQFVS